MIYLKPNFDILELIMWSPIRQIFKIKMPLKLYNCMILLRHSWLSIHWPSLKIEWVSWLIGFNGEFKAGWVSWNAVFLSMVGFSVITYCGLVNTFIVWISHVVTEVRFLIDRLAFLFCWTAVIWIYL